MLDRKYPEWGKNTEGKRFHACRWNPIFLIRHSFERFKAEYWNFLTTSSQKQRQSLRSPKMPALCLVLLETLLPSWHKYDYEIGEGQAAHQQVKRSAAEDLSFISPQILCQFHVIFIPENDLRALLVPCYCGHLTSDVTSVEYHHFNKVEELHIPSWGWPFQPAAPHSVLTADFTAPSIPNKWMLRPQWIGSHRKL